VVVAVVIRQTEQVEMAALAVAEVLPQFKN
jgi:hypothetical protein